MNFCTAFQMCGSGNTEQSVGASTTTEKKPVDVKTLEKIKKAACNFVDNIGAIQEFTKEHVQLSRIYTLHCGKEKVRFSDAHANEYSLLMILIGKLGPLKSKLNTAQQVSGPNRFYLRQCGWGEMLDKLNVEEGRKTYQENIQNLETILDVFIDALDLEDINARVERSFLNKRYTRSALDEAMQEKLEQVAIKLINRGAHIDLPQNVTGRPPLVGACFWELRELTHLLIARGARVNVHDYDDLRTPLHHACNNFWADTAKLLHNKAQEQLLKETSSTMTSTASATQLDDKQKMAAFLSAKDVYGQTPLHLISSWGNIATNATKRLEECFEVLLTLGGKEICNVKNQHGATPLFYAAAHKSRKLFDRMLEVGADRDLVNLDELTKYVKEWNPSGQTEVDPEILKVLCKQQDCASDIKK